jgi:hypothetical protein
MADHRNNTLFIVTLPRLADGVMGEASNVVDIVTCCGSRARKRSANEGQG